MDSTGQQLLKLLFNEDENVCVSKNKYGYHSVPLHDALSDEVELISPNSDIKPSKCKTDDLILCALNPINGFRVDENVAAFRSFLIEIDVGTTKEQLGTIAHLKMPWSAQVFSGNKSVHTAITLSEDLPNEKTYRYLVKWIFNIVAHVDKNCINPSRSIRIPGVYREPGKKQRLIRIKDRISQKELLDWLNKYEHLKPKVREKRVIPEGEADFNRLGPWTRGMLIKKCIKFDNGRNKTWFSMAVDFAKAGFTEDQCIEILSQHFEEEHDFKEKEWLTSIHSGFKHVEDGK